jgi:hypothetical protein
MPCAEQMHGRAFRGSDVGGVLSSRELTDPDAAARGVGAPLLHRRKSFAVLVGCLLLCSNNAFAAVSDVPLEPANRIVADAPSWRDLVAQFAQQPDGMAEFEERRFFPFRKEPVVLRGEVRVSRARGLSLHYTTPEERTVVVDQQGMLVRDGVGATSPPDPRGAAGVAALVHILRFDFAALEKDFESYGRRDGAAWSLVLVPRADTVRRAMGNIHVSGDGGVVQTIELRRSAKQHIDIAMSAFRSPVTFSAEDVKRYFR